MMPSRRFLLTVSAAWLVIGQGARAQSTTDRASAFVKATGDKLVAAVNGSGSAQQKRQMLTQVIDSTVDVDGVARFCLGRFWKQASPDQQKRYMTIFHQVLVSNITSKLGEYQGVRFTMGRSEPDGENAKVDTVVDRPNSPPTNVQWIIGNPASDPKIVDVVAEGTSLRLTQRSDYASYLSHNNNNIDALISAMQQQVEQAHASG
jgi:phospholipid transport system substrate-binding protein